MTVREEIAEITRRYANNRESWAGSFVQADQILSIKVGSRTLKEVLELQEQDKLRIEAEK